MLCYPDEYQFLVIWYGIDLLFIGVTFAVKHGNICHLVRWVILGHVWWIFLLTEGNLFKLSVSLGVWIKPQQSKVYQ